MATEKFEALVHFLIHECREHPSRLGAVRLNKALWYTDVSSYQMTGMPVSGETYVKRKMGPVPAHILITLRKLQNDGKIHIQEPEFQYDVRKFVSLSNPDEDALSRDEREIAKGILEAVCGCTANEISEISHDVIWAAAAEGETIPLYATLASEQGEVSDDVRAWAGTVVSRLELEAA